MNKNNAKLSRQDATLLVVDDIPENLELFADVLLDEGYNVITAESGMQALEVLSNRPVDLIVADALMPKMDGLELCKRVKTNGALRTIPFIIYTGNYIDPEDEELAKSIGVDRYVMKSSGLNGLIVAIEELLNLTSNTETIPKPEPTTSSQQQIDEQSFLERHHTIVTKKLEEKMKELEQYAEVLTQRNRELMVSESRYRGLFEHAVVGIVVLDCTTKKIIDVNRQCCAFFDCNREEIMNGGSLPLFDNEGNQIDVFSIVSSQGNEARLKRKNKSDLYVEINAGPIDLPEDTASMLLFLRDITEQKRIREQMLQSERMSTMGRIAAGIAHEIRNPLAGISLNLQFLDRRLEQNSPEHNSVTASLEGVARIQQVIEDTLGLARVKPPSFQKEDIHQLIERTLSYLKLVFRQKSIKLEKQYTESLPKIYVDASQIQQVLLNIIENAVDASQEGGTLVITTEEKKFNEEEEKKYVKVSIRDYGIGFPREVLEHLFEPFHTTKTDGTGLGLMLSKYIIDRHQGMIEVENAPDKGACVSIYLPV
ncbi:MAG: response regulator [Bacteroidetes bacterium]|nr:response regulator [Bacteroidota bacterium]